MFENSNNINTENNTLNNSRVVDHSTSKKCPNCGTLSPGIFCLNCGTNMENVITSNNINNPTLDNHSKMEQPLHTDIPPIFLNQNEPISSNVYTHIDNNNPNLSANEIIQPQIFNPLVVENQNSSLNIDSGNSINEPQTVESNNSIGGIEANNLNMNPMISETQSISNNIFGEENNISSVKPVNVLENNTNVETNNDSIDQSNIIQNTVIAGVFPNVSDNFVNNEASSTNSQPNFFEYDFANETKNNITPVVTEEKVADELLTFDFESVIREQKVEEVIPQQENRIELTKLLEPKENLIKKASEVSENDNNVIHINEDDSKSFHRKRKFMKAALSAFYVFIVFFLTVFAYTFYQQKNTFTLNRNEISLAIGSTYPIEVIMNANIEDNFNYEWSSIDDSVAIVNDSGVVTAMGKGTTKIIVKSKKTRKSKELLVHALSISVDSLKFTKNKMNLTVGDTTTILPIINNDETIIIDLIWESNNPNIVSVDSNGQITAISKGTATVTVYEEISGLSDEITITVEEKKIKPKPNNNNEKINVTGISLSKTSAKLTVGDSITVTANIKPNNATDKKVSWTSSNNNIATVSKNGKITAKKAGTATITVKTNDGNKTANIKITVVVAPPSSIAVTDVSLNKTQISLDVGESETLIATVKPNNATNKNVSWASSDNSVATVDSNGKVTAKKAGTATITVTTENSGKKASAEVKVTEPQPSIIEVTGVSLNKTQISLNIGESGTLIATVKPDDATNKKVSWTSSDNGIATVDSNGKVTAISEGTTTIIVTTEDGKFTAKCTITVKAEQEPPKEE